MSATDDDLSIATVYAAEDGVQELLRRGGIVDFYGTTLDLAQNRVRSFEQWQLPFMQAMIEALYQKHRAGGPVVGPVLRESKKAGHPHYRPGKHEIVLPSQAVYWTDLVLCHELAHALTPDSSGGNRAAHDLAWRRTYCALVSEVVGREASMLLQSALNL
ncbi:MAG: hypothetical protein EHM13_08480 [Acidobacteria bacterium]|nr:MAG: hypothetical protein EHM13_08480 [Acidobacteriota bacterium]